MIFFLSFASSHSRHALVQNLQQSRGFGNNFRFPEGTGPSGSTSAPAGNAGFQDDTQEDDLYA